MTDDILGLENEIIRGSEGRSDFKVVQKAQGELGARDRHSEAIEASAYRAALLVHQHTDTHLPRHGVLPAFGPRAIYEEAPQSA